MISFLTFIKKYIFNKIYKLWIVLMLSILSIILAYIYQVMNHELSTKNLKIMFRNQGDQDKCVSSSSFK